MFRTENKMFLLERLTFGITRETHWKRLAMPASTRFHHLDAMRSFCMAFGIPVHAALIYNNVFAHAAGVASTHFRMASFFLISGFFTSMIAARSSTRGLVLRRARILLIPFVTMVILVNPMTLFLIHIHESGEILFSNFIFQKYISLKL